ncbi:MAG: hypothetical protein HDQ93_02605 [Desulfovibrio sp.]|nr:hypothetical protein [Desulfovibrio sp.]
MGSFLKGMTFTMEGKEYEVIGEGTDDPSSCLVYVLRDEKETADPQTLRLWKAEAKLARGDIMISGYSDDRKSEDRRGSFYPPVIDPLEQIAELKKRIQAIERRRISLLKVDDPKGSVLLQDNIVRPNKRFDLWNYTRASGDLVKKARKIQYAKLRGIALSLSAPGAIPELFLFNISDQLQPCCRIADNSLSSEGRIKLDLSSRLKTVLGKPSGILSPDMGGRVELDVELRLECDRTDGMMIVRANISRASFIREINAPSLTLDKIGLTDLAELKIAIEGICVDMYTDGPDFL